MPEPVAWFEIELVELSNNDKTSRVAAIPVNASEAGGLNDFSVARVTFFERERERERKREKVSQASSVKKRMASFLLKELTGCHGGSDEVHRSDRNKVQDAAFEDPLQDRNFAPGVSLGRRDLVQRQRQDGRVEQQRCGPTN